MSLYEGVAFRGTFRDYQQRVLDYANQYIAEGKLNIVMPPGSGKTILGLELIRGIGETCLIISPTDATRDYWGKKLKECFVEEERRFQELFSTDLDRAKVINALTYEELEDCMESYASDGEKKTVKLRRMIRDGRIHTICLDEPHHLKPECLVTLGKMQEVLEQDVKIISLSTTPPCAYEEAEQQRFLEVCGTIDTRILAWELVEEKVLCPHQDYIYFNIPSGEEVALLREHMERVQSAMEEIGRLEQVQSALKELAQLEGVQVSIKTGKLWKSIWTYQCNRLYDKINRCTPEAYIPILQFLQFYGLRINQYKTKRVPKNKELPSIQIKDIQIALQFISEHYDILGEHRKPIMQILRKYRLYQEKRVRLVPDELMYQVFTASVGKFHSIGDIVNREYQTLGKELRQLVFTEGMHGNTGNLAYVGTNEEFQSVDAISIFETLRRQEIEIKIGVLTEELLILPNYEELQGTMMRMEPLGDTKYAKVEFFGGMQDAVGMVKDLLREGKIQVLIGDQVLREDAWKESGINSLILPGFSKDFIRPHTIRGSVLRGEPDHPEKCVNIWHLTTLMPAEMVCDISSPSQVPANNIQNGYLGAYDFEMVRNRFQLFVGPDYEASGPERTISRILLYGQSLKDSELQHINKKMLEDSVDRENIRKLWKEKILSRRQSTG